MKITVERLREVLRYNPDTGEWMWLVAPNRRIRAGDVAGSVTAGGYRMISVDGHRDYAHRLAWLYMTGEWPVEDIDHRDMDHANNRWENLRVATRAQNIANSGIRSTNKSGFKGVHWSRRKKRWCAAITIRGKEKHLGYFIELGQAHVAYRRAAEEAFGEFARAG